MPSSTVPDVRPGLRGLFRAAAIFATVIVAAGAINSATGSGFACPTWPGCYPHRFGPEAEIHAVIEFGHRIIAGIGMLTLLAAAIASLRLPRTQPLAKILPWVAVVGAVAAAVFGMMTVRDLGLAKPLSVLDLFGALSCLVGSMIAFCSVQRARPRWRWTRLATLAGACLAGLYALHLLGIVVAGPHSFTPVVGWPMRATVEVDLYPWLQIVRLVLAVALAVGLVWLAVRSWRHSSLRTPAVVLVVALLVELALGQVIAAKGTDLWFATIYCTAAVAMVAATTLILARAALDHVE